MIYPISLKQYLQTYGKIIFLSFIFFTFIIHGYAMSNIVGNNDTMGIISGKAGAGTSSGRWFLDILVKICQVLFGNVYFLPWFNLFLGFFFITCSSFLILYLFQVESKITIIFITALMITFPATTSMALYGYTFHFNMLSLSLSILSIVLCLKMTIISSLFSIILLVISLGIYQAYLPFACAILVLFWIKMLIDSQSHKIVTHSIIFCGITIVLGVILYFILTKIFCLLFHISLSSYKGIDHMTSIPSLKNLFLSVIYSYGLLIILPFKTLYGLNVSVALKIAIAIYYVFSISIIICIYKKISGNLFNKFLITILFIIFPLAANLIFLMVNGDKTAVYAAMLYGTNTIFLFVPLFFKEKPFSIIEKYGIYFTMSSIILLWGGFSNGVYTASHHVIEQNIIVWNRIITEVESLENYNEQMALYIIGEHPVFPSIIDSYQDFQHLVSLNYVCDWSLPHFLKNYLGWDKRFISEPLEISNELPIYPNKGSITIIDDIVVIRFE